MNPKLNLFQRFMAEAPAFEKKVQFFSLVALFVLALLAHFNVIPTGVADTLGTIAGTAVGVSSFAVKECSVLATGITGDSLMQMIADLSAEFAKVKTALATPTPLASIESTFSELAAEVKDNTAAKPAEAAAPAAQEATIVSISAPAPDPAA